MQIVENILTRNPCFKAGKKIKVQGLMLHSVGCPQPSAEVFVRNWNNEAASRACVHAFIDGNTGVVYQTLPWDHRAWHCGSGANGSANNTHIGVEMCEPACIKYTGGSSFVCSDTETAKAVVERTYESAVQLFATLCKMFDLKPMTDGVIISHREGHARGIASGHGDPEHLWKGIPCGYTMDGFRRDVQAAMQSDSEPEDMSISEKGIALIARYEGCRLEAYQCAAGVWTIGYGHTAGVKPGDRLESEEAAKALLREDVKKYGDYVNACVRKGLIGFPLTQNMFDALTSFCYNCGNGNLQKLVSGRDAMTVADKMLLYNKGGGRVLPGLVRRRNEEKELFLSIDR